MEDVSFSSTVVLTIRRAATFVTMPASSRFLVPLLGRERTASELAAEVGVNVGAAGYRLRQMLALGLIKRTRLQVRAGRSIAHYQAVADRVFAPLELTPIDSLGELFRQGLADISADIDTAIEQGWLQIGRSAQWGTLIYRQNRNGPVNRDFVPIGLSEGSMFWAETLADGAPPVWSQHATLDLPIGLAKQLQRELAGIVTRYAELASKQTDKRGHHLQLALAPTTNH